MREQAKRLLLGFALVTSLSGCAGSAAATRPQPPTSLVAAAPKAGFPRLDDRPDGPRAGAIVWQRELEGPVVPGPVEGLDGSVLAAGNGGVLHALDPANGKDRWSFDGRGYYGSDLSTSPAVRQDGSVIWPGPRSTVFALDGGTGESLWRTQTSGSPLTPALDGDRIYVQDDAGTLTALDAGGARLWSVRLGSTSYSSPAVGDDGTVYSAADRTLFAVREGRIAWKLRTDDLIEVSPAVAPDGTITIGSNDRVQYGVSPSGRVRWRFDIGVWTYSSPEVTSDGLIYFGDHLGRVNGVDARTGDLRYRVAGRGKTRNTFAIWSRPVVDARHRVYFGTRLGHVYGFSQRARPLFDVDLGAAIDSYPTLTRDGLLVIGTEAGTLTAIG